MGSTIKAAEIILTASVVEPLRSSSNLNPRNVNRKLWFEGNVNVAGIKMFSYVSEI